jgi:hypothetical protein
MSLYILVYQKSHAAGEIKFVDYLRRKGFARFSNGVYHALNHGQIDKEKMWKECQEKFHFDPHHDFFAIFDCVSEFRGGNAHYMGRKSPPWPQEDS